MSDMVGVLGKKDRRNNSFIRVSSTLMQTKTTENGQTRMRVDVLVFAPQFHQLSSES